MYDEPFEELSEEQKKIFYNAYRGEVIYEFGDSAKYYSYDEWCEECKKVGVALV